MLEQDFTNLLNDAEKYQFIVDFGKSEMNVLQELNSNYGSSLIQEWKQITYLKNERRSTTFLKNARGVLSDEDFKIHFSKGDIFEIEMESVLYTCTNCQKYLQAAQLYAKSVGKTINVKFIAPAAQSLQL